MTIEYEVTDLNAVGEELCGAYEQAEGGKYRLNLDKFTEIRTAPLLAKNKQLLDEKKKLDQSLKSTQPDKDRIADLEREVKHYKLTVPLRDLAVKAGVIAEDLDLVLLDVQKRFALDDDGQIVTLDDHGNPTGVTPQKFFETLYKEQRPKFYRASGAGGSGAGQSKGGGGGSSKTMTRAAFEALSSDDKVSFSKGGGTLTD